MIVKLNTAEQKLAKYLAKTRFQENRSRGTVNSKIGKQSNWETDLEGIAAELAWCKINNVYPDMDTDHIPEIDAVTHCGYRIDIKTTKHEKGHLLAVSWKQQESIDFYCLMIGTFPEYRVAGYLNSSCAGFPI